MGVCCPSPRTIAALDLSGLDLDVLRHFSFPTLACLRVCLLIFYMKLILVRYLPHSMFTFYRLQGYLYEPMLFQPCFALSHCHFIYTSVHLS